MSRMSCGLAKEIGLPLHEFGPDGELGACEAERFLRERLGHAGELEHHAAGLDHSHPVLGRALPRAHARLGGLRGHGLVREDVDPDLASALDLARHGDTSSLDLAVRYPAGLERLETEVAGAHGGLPLRDATPAATLVHAELGLLGEEH